MADDDKLSARFNRDEEDLKKAFYETLAQAKKQQPDIVKGDVIKTLMQRGLQAEAERGRTAAIAEGDLAIIKGQVNKIAQSVRKLEDAMDAIREDLATTALVLLQYAGKLDSGKAQKWVEENLTS
jgi:hypothetical protein